MRILIAEDNVALTSALEVYLSKGGHEVDVAADGGTALQLAAAKPYDVLVLDYDLPVVHGADVLRRVREAGNTVPVLLFSAMHDVERKLAVRGLSADAFLGKPFGLRDFETALNRLGRRAAAAPRGVVAFGSLSCDLASGTVRLDGTVLPALPADEQALLERLLGSGSDPVPEDELGRTLAARAGGGAVDVETCVARLRSRLGEGAVRIVRLRGIGYCLANT